MGIRRRRKKLTTVITAVDRRLKTVESRVVPTRIAANAITAVELAPDAIPVTDPKDSGATGAVPSESDPSVFAVITAAAYSAKNITGGDDWIDITTSQPHGLSVGEKVSIYGLNNNGVNADGTYVITEVGSTTTFRYKVGLTGYYSAVVNLAVSATVTQRSCTLTEATLVLSSSAHGYAVGEVITVSGVDDAFNGTFFVSYANGATIKYKFIEPVATSVPITSSSGLVKALAHKYTIIGDTWIDTSVTPSVYKIWDGLSWQLGTSLPDGVIINDYMAPAPPTGLSAETNGYYNPNTGNANVAVTLTWTAPTTNADSTPLTDLAGYKVFYKYNVTSSPEDGSSAGDPSNEWVSAGDTNETTFSMRDFNIASTVDFAVQAYDSSRMNYSVYSDTLSVSTGTPALVLNKPSAPSVETRLGTVTVRWDGNDYTAATPPPTLAYVNVYLGSSSSFTPDSSTLKGQIAGNGADSLIITGLTYGTTYYAKLIFVDTTGSLTAASNASAGVTVLALVDTDVIGKVISGAKIVDGSITASDAIIGNTITGNLIQSNTIEAGSIKTNSLTANQIQAGALDAFQITGANIRTAASGGRIVLTSAGMTAYASNGTTQTFNINSSTGAVTIGGYATTSDLSGKISTGNAASDINTYTTTISGGKITTGTIDGSAFNATTRIRLGDSNTTTPNNYIEFGYVTLPGIGSTSAPGIIGQYGGSRTFYVGGWNGGAGSTSGVALGVVGNNGSTAVDVLTAGGYDNGLSLASTVALTGGKVDVTSYGGNASDSSFGDLTLQSTGYGAINLLAPSGVDLNGRYLGVYVSPALLIGKQTTSNWQATEGTHISSGFVASSNVSGNAFSMSRMTTNGTVCVFYRGTTTAVGNISLTTTATTYNTSSDYRLKENISPLLNSVQKLKALKPRTFNFIVEPDEIVDGFIAHELAEVVPNAVTGTKDAVNENGEPEYQGIDMSRLVPILTSALQEAMSQIDVLSARIDVLETR